MEALMQTGARMVASSSTANVCSCSSAAGCSVQSAAPRKSSSSMTTLHVLDRSKLRQKFMRSSSREVSYNGSLMPFRIRAEQPTGGGSVEEKVREIASDEAVEGPGTQDRNSKLKADELRESADDQSPLESTELPVAADLLLETLKAEDESAEDSALEKDAALQVASDSAVESPETFFHDVEDSAQEVAAKLDRSVSDEVLELKDAVEDFAEQQKLEGKVVKEEETHEVESSAPADGTLPATRAEAQEKLQETAKEGYEVLRWAAEGIVSAGKNARQGIEVAKEIFGKRVKSFNIAADETKEVSSQMAENALKKLTAIHSSTSQFGEELQVNLEDKKAADSLKPEYERNPLTKLGHEAQERFNQATSEDGPLGNLGQEIQQNYNKFTSEGPLAQLNETVSETLSKASQAGRDLSTRVSERAAELSEKTSEETEKAKENTGDSVSDLTSTVRAGDVAEQLKGVYEDERGNELLKGQISNNDAQTTLIDADEPQAVPSKKEDGSDIGHDE